MDKLVEFKEMKAGMRELTEMNLDLVHQVSRLEEAWEKRRVRQEERWWSPSPVRPKRKQALWFARGDGSKERPYVELGLLSKGVLVEEELVASGSGMAAGECTPVMVMAPSTPLPASLEELDWIVLQFHPFLPTFPTPSSPSPCPKLQKHRQIIKTHIQDIPLSPYVFHSMLTFILSPMISSKG